MADRPSVTVPCLETAEVSRRTESLAILLFIGEGGREGIGAGSIDSPPETFLVVVVLPPRGTTIVLRLPMRTLTGPVELAASNELLVRENPTCRFLKRCDEPVEDEVRDNELPEVVFCTIGFPVLRPSFVVPAGRSRISLVVGSADMVLSIRVDEESDATDGALENDLRGISPTVSLLKE